MAWLPTSNIPIQYMDENGVPYSGAVLKFYAAGTSTNIAVSTSQTGTPTVTSVALNSDGYPEVSSNTVVIFVDQDFKVALYPTQAAADSNTGAVWMIDNVDPFAVLTLPTNLADINALSPADGTVIVGDGTEWVAETGNTARTSLGLGSGNSPSFTNVTLSGLTTGRTVISNSAGALTALNTATKGTIAVGNGTTTAALAVGTDGYILRADSGATSGVAWSMPADIDAITTVTATAAATALLNSGITSAYSVYDLICVGTTSTADGLSLRVELAGSVISTSTYIYASTGILSGTGDVSTTEAGVGSPVSSVPLAGPGGGATRPFYLKARIINPSSGTLSTQLVIDQNVITSTGQIRRDTTTAMNTGTSALTGIQLIPTAGTITCTMNLYPANV